MGEKVNQTKDRPWLMRTYSGYASARESNMLYRANMAKGQTGLSIAFDLPTQTGYDSDHVLAHGEVGKLGVPMRNHEDMETLFHQIQMDKINTSMTINAPAAWVFALYIATAKKQGVDISKLRGTVQNDILKEYLSRGTYIFPPKASMRLTAEIIGFTVNNIPKWNPINICSYHLQESGATPVQELAFTLANAIAVLDAVKEAGEIKEEAFSNVVGRISFFLNSGIRFIEEMCKISVFKTLWDQICKERYHVKDPKLRRFRYGIQVNSLGLTGHQPENNIARIIYEFLGVTLSKDNRARSVQLPAWNEALGLPRKWDQQWSLRLQQILAFETDLLEYKDIFAGSIVIEKKEKELKEEALAELDKIMEMGGAVAAIENGYMKQSLVESNAKRIKAIETGEQIVVGVNQFQKGEASPLVKGMDGAFLKIDERIEHEQTQLLHDFKRRRNQSKVKRALDELKESLNKGENIMDVSIRCVHVGVTTGEWSGAMRETLGEYRAPTGISGIVQKTSSGKEVKDVIHKVKKLGKALGRNLRILIGKPGLDGHSNGAEQIAVKAKGVGMEVVYEGIRITPERIAETALQEGVHVIGLSILSGSHLSLVPDIISCMKERGLDDIPIVLGGIIPEEDAKKLDADIVRKVYTPKDYNLNKIMSEIVDVVVAKNNINLDDEL